MSNTDFVLAIEDLTLSFDGFKAIDALTLYVDRGELRVIIGPNGAGKTTLLDLICGKTKASGGSDNVPTSIGHGWQKGPRNSPTVLNAVFNAAQFWDGRAKDLQQQAKGPVQASVEMNSTP